MKFDKKQYWKNRKANKRGQGEQFDDNFQPNDGKHIIQTETKIQYVNRETYRRLMKPWRRSRI